MHKHESRLNPALAIVLRYPSVRGRSRRFAVVIANVIFFIKPSGRRQRESGAFYFFRVGTKDRLRTTTSVPIVPLAGVAESHACSPWKKFAENIIVYNSIRSEQGELGKQVKESGSAWERKRVCTATPSPGYIYHNPGVRPHRLLRNIS